MLSVLSYVTVSSVGEAVELGMYGAPFIKIESPAAGDSPMVCFGTSLYKKLADFLVLRPKPVLANDCCS